MRVKIINEVHNTGTTRREWIENLTNLYADVFPYSKGRIGLAYRTNEAGELELPEGFYSPDGLTPETIFGITEAFNNALDRGSVKRLFNEIACASFTQRLGELNANHLLEQTMPFGVQDSIAVVSGNFDGTGFLFASFQDSQTRVSKIQRREWMYVAAHIAAVARIRMSYKTDYFALADWIYDKKTGRVVDAKPNARDKKVSNRLIKATKTIDRNRVSKDEDTVSKWAALTEGKWTLLDVLDGSQTYVVAIPNDPRVRLTVSLTNRQSQILWFLLHGHSQAFVAYELGLTQTVVSRLLVTLRKKFGAKTTVELLRLTRGVLPQTSLPPELTDVQKMLMDCMAKGLSDAEIATRRNRSVKTVRNQIQTIYRLLGVNSRAELVARFAF